MRRPLTDKQGSDSAIHVETHQKKRRRATTKSIVQVTSTYHTMIWKKSPRMLCH